MKPRKHAGDIARSLGLDPRLANEYMRRLRDHVMVEDYEVELENIGIFTKQHRNFSTRTYQTSAFTKPARDVLRMRGEINRRANRYDLMTDFSYIWFSFDVNGGRYTYKLDWKTGLILVHDPEHFPSQVPAHTIEHARIGVSSTIGPRLYYQYTDDIKYKHYLVLPDGARKFKWSADGETQLVDVDMHFGAIWLQDIENPSVGLSFNGSSNETDANPDIFLAPRRSAQSILRWMFRNRGSGNNCGNHWTLTG